jgi:hypothetical protein
VRRRFNLRSTRRQKIFTEPGAEISQAIKRHAFPPRAGRNPNAARTLCIGRGEHDIGSKNFFGILRNRPEGKWMGRSGSNFTRESDDDANDRSALPIAASAAEFDRSATAIDV